MTTEGRHDCPARRRHARPQGGGGAARDGLVRRGRGAVRRLRRRRLQPRVLRVRARRARIESAASRSSSALRRQRRTHSRRSALRRYRSPTTTRSTSGRWPCSTPWTTSPRPRSPRPARVPTSIGPGAARSCRRAGCGSGCSPRPTIRRVRRRAGLTGRGLRRSARGAPGMDPHGAGATPSRADVVVAFPHWGPNMTSEPAGWQRARARELVAAGADLVAGHSAHIFHGIEWIGDRAVSTTWRRPRRLRRRSAAAERPRDRRPMAPARRAPARAGGARAPLLRDGARERPRCGLDRRPARVRLRAVRDQVERVAEGRFVALPA